MATNPLFQVFRKREVFVNINNGHSFKTTIMAQRGDQLGSKRGGSGETEDKPQRKRQRLDNPPDDAGDWDDSFEFTQQDLETLDVVASQAICEPSTSKQETELNLEHGGTEQTLELESTSFSVTEGRGQQSLFQAPVPGATVRLKNRSSTSSSSESSVYPLSSASLRKTSTSDVSSVAGSLTSSKSSSNRSLEEPLPGDVTVITPGMSVHSGAASASNIVSVTVTALREDLRKKAEEVQKARNELYAKDGEVKFLKDSLHKQEAELEKLRTEREERKDAEQRQQTEREKELKLEVERLETQVQFKTQDYMQLQQRCRMLESKLANQQSTPSVAQPSTSTGAVTMSQPQSSPDKSPKVRKVVRGNRTPEKGAFPSPHSFMTAPVVSPSGIPTHTSRSREMMTTADLQASAPSQAVSRVAQSGRRLRLGVPCPGGKTPGAQLVSQLLQCSCTTNGEIEDSGILGLLQMLPSRHDLTELQYERDGSTARLSPVKKARRQSSPGVYVPPQPPPAACKSVVEREHFLLAAQGLRNLVDLSTQTTQTTASTSQQTQPPQPSGAVLLLPMLNDYLSHYLDILSSSGTAATPGIASPNLSSSSNKSSSCEAGSSLESMTSSLVLLFQQGAEYANSVETLTLCALRVLHTLVCVSEEVRSVCVRSRVGAPLLQPATDTSSSTIETDHEKDKANESGMEGDDEESTPSSKDSLIISPAESLSSPAHRLQGLNLLIKLLRLASPGHQSSGFKGSIVEAALDILIALANNLPDVDVARLHVIILRGVLTDCLQLDQQPNITVRALDLFSCLVQSHSILPFLCTKTDTCTLLNVHLVATRLLAGSRGRQQSQPQLLHIISKVVESVSSMASFHRNGVHYLTDNNCRCSRQFIPSLVHAMFYLLREYQVSDSDDVLGVLRKGVLLLHNISIQDPNYQQSHSVVHLHYSTLMSGLTPIYRRLKSQEALPQEEVSALEDLWEEADESDTGSQDSDTGEPMVVE